jgi:hypothetical protein
MHDIPYRESIGSFMYASLVTRPDITFAVSRLSKFLEKPGMAHWDALRCVFHYLKGMVESMQLGQLCGLRLSDCKNIQSGLLNEL